MAEPREGLHYIVDPYAVLGFERDIPQGNVIREYHRHVMGIHPDRVAGTAYEEDAKRRTAIAGWAGRILTDPDKRAEYDQLLQEWGNGPVSRDGNPVMTMEAYAQLKYQGLEAGQVEAELTAHEELLVPLRKGRPDMVASTGSMINKLPDTLEFNPIKIGLRLQLDALLQDLDGDLRMSEVGLLMAAGVRDVDPNERLTDNYADKVAERIETLKTAHRETFDKAAAIQASGRLALTSSFDALGVSSDIVPAEYQESVLLTAVEPRLTKIAHERQAILDVRIANAIDPSVERPDFYDKVAIGIKYDSQIIWIFMDCDYEAKHFEDFELDDEARRIFTDRNYDEAIAQGYNVVLVVGLEGVEPESVLTATLRYHYERYMKAQQKQ